MSAKTYGRQQAVAELILACCIWGFGFIAAQWALESFPPMLQTGGRLCVGALFLLPLVRRETMPLAQLLKITLLPGIFLGLTLWLQTWGLLYTTATRSGFITTLYVLFVPLIELLWDKKAIRRDLWIWVFVALLGTALICKLQEGGQWNLGDLLTLGCAIAAAFQIHVVGKVANSFREPLALNALQILWAGLPLLLAGLMFEQAPAWHAITSKAWLGFFLLAIGSSAIAFGIQVRAQRVLSASTASFIFLLESPLAALFSFLIWNEQLTAGQWWGAFLILLSSGMVIWTNQKK